MALHRGPKIIKDGLILCLDAADRKSYTSGSNNWNDRSGKLASASLSGSPAFNSSNGGSIVFDDDNDYANIANNTLFKFTNTDPFSICFWTYWTGTTGVDYLFNFGNKGLQGLDNAIEKNKWVNIVFTNLNNSATNMRFYSNGALGSYDIRGDVSPASISYASASLRIGVRANVDYYNGRIANVLIYNRQLTNSEVAFNFQSQRNRFGV
jgi:hypothetical protein